MNFPGGVMIGRSATYNGSPRDGQVGVHWIRLPNRTLLRVEASGRRKVYPAGTSITEAERDRWG